MVFGGRLQLVLLLYGTFCFCRSKKLRSDEGKHIFSLLGHSHRYKIEYANIYQIPLIIVPVFNQYQSVNIHKSPYNKSKQENSKIKYVKNPDSNSSSVNDWTEDNDIEIRFKKPFKRSSKKPEKQVKDEIFSKLRQAEDTTNQTALDAEGATSSTTVETMTEVPASTDVTGTEPVTFKSSTTTLENGVYPSAHYNNNFINSIQLTNTDLPPLENNKWQNFSSTKIGDVLHKNVSTSNIQQISSTTELSGPYPSASYDNTNIKHISLTNKYLPKDHFQGNVIWNKLLSESLLNPSEFKPLAGLYYDGFLHRPLKKFGFIP